MRKTLSYYNRWVNHIEYKKNLQNILIKVSRNLFHAHTQLFALGNYICLCSQHYLYLIGSGIFFLFDKLSINRIFFLIPFLFNT